MDDAFVSARIEATKSAILAYEGAVLALGVSGGVESYELDTGQDRQRVTRSSVPALNRMLDGLYNRLATLEARVYGGAITMRPGW
jgi:hypothetical protein